MTISDIQRAALILYAAHQAIETNSLNAMLAVCLCIRNRVRAGWHDGQWLSVIQNAPAVDGNDYYPPPVLDVHNRAFQQLTLQADQVYFASNPLGELEAALGDAKYWQFIDRAPRRWFVDNIVRQPEYHQLRHQVGPIMFFS